MLTGGRLRGHEQYRQLFIEAGLAEPEQTTIGWGFTLYGAPEAIA